MEGEAKMYKAIRNTWTHVGGKLRVVEKGQFVSLFEKEVTKHFKEVDCKSNDALSARILNALNELDHNNDAHWTDKGLPRMETLEAIMRENVTRLQVEAVKPGFDRDMVALSQIKAPPSL